jgi:hypothetical protein
VIFAAELKGHKVQTDQTRLDDLRAF